jgi:hypothetical protein
MENKMAVSIHNNFGFGIVDFGFSKYTVSLQSEIRNPKSEVRAASGSEKGKE